jgi:hypothetical protein
MLNSDQARYSYTHKIPISVKISPTNQFQGGTNTYESEQYNDRTPEALSDDPVFSRKAE